MKIIFDHVVHYVNDPYRTMEAFQMQGFHTSKGGKHDNWGTYNTLSYFKHLSYIEWIAIDKVEIAKKANHPFSNHILEDSKVGEGLSQIAFRTSSIEDVKAELTRKGVNTLGPFPGSRKRPDGSLLEWSMLFIEHDSPMPFFIQWGQDDKIREKEFLASGLLLPDAKELSYIYYSVRDPDRTSTLWAKLFNGERSNSEIPSPFKKGKIDAKKVKVDQFAVYFCEVPEYNEKRGERPFLVGIQPSDGENFVLSGAYYEV